MSHPLVMEIDKHAIAHQIYACRAAYSLVISNDRMDSAHFLSRSVYPVFVNGHPVTSRPLGLRW